MERLVFSDGSISWKRTNDPEQDHEAGAYLDDPPAADTCDPDRTDVLGVGRGAVAGAPYAVQQNADALQGPE